MTAFSQFKGSLSGMVVNRNTQASLSEVSLQLQPANIGLVADSTGRFRFTSIIPGSYSLLVSRVGYLPQTISNLVVTTGNENTISIEMEEDIVQLSGVVVSSSTNRAKATT
ncbi:MAG: carboxypeptidase-like regulatory domain-containing protein, partial [Ferruginibacter sp.]